MNSTNFNLEKSIQILERTPAVLKALFYNLGEDWITVNEGPQTWSAYDILGHLIHGENTDWIPRAKIILGDGADKTFEPFDRFAQKELSKGKSMEQLLDEFAQLRESSVQILKSWSLSQEDLAKKGNHPELGAVTLGQLLATWTIHDLAHLNQVSRVMVKHYADSVGLWRQYISLLK
ncbi:DinB family protein [Flagellimonas flava]|uniref:DinB superfamily protein n=1 Tax=Flagellimonas flava TaxID=570519 RepID=A0A1M5KYB9_9FLAO|nr:DinB family protein [Allomuricauda flava]SHG57814.1 DinB superfamily protein [Allomuricauda flava]